jgi:GT2 family glycosyltransferase
MKISIVLAYVNRKRLFYETLKSITKTKYNDFEVIAVDDCSLPEERIEEFLTEFKFLKVIRLEPENKWYVNTCIPYNIGIRAAKGDIIILQNAECLHVHDVITYLSENVNDSNYISVSTYALNEEITNQLPSLINKDDFLVYFKSLPQQETGGSPIIGWYNHSTYRPVHYHFCSAITKRNLNLLGGFDERYAWGTSYEDTELIERIRRMGLRMIIVDEISVLHQWHVNFQYQHPNFAQNHARNRSLLHNVTMNERGYKVN